jgi:YHS domain-containing protein
MTMRIAVVLQVLLALTLAGATAAAGPKAPSSDAKPAVQAQVRCPVTGEVVDDPSTAAKSVYKGTTYYFCCPGCKPKFDADPEKYLKKAGGDKAPGAAPHAMH